MNHTTNPTGIKKIPHSLFSIRISEDSGNTKKINIYFSSGFKSRFKNNSNEKVIVWAMSGYSSTKYDMGSVDNVSLDGEKDLELLHSDKVVFRVLIVDPKSSKISASAENVRGRTKDDCVGRDSILPVRIVDSLGDETWKMNLDEDVGPTLFLNKKFIGIEVHIKNNALFQSLIIPYAVRVSVHFLIENDHADSEDTETWQYKWRYFLEGLNSAETMPSSVNDEGFEGWMDDVIKKFTKKRDLLKKSMDIMEKISND
jgi:hypothetical protein